MKTKEVIAIALGLVIVIAILFLTKGISFPKIRAVATESLDTEAVKDNAKAGDAQEAERLTLHIANLHAAYQRADANNKPKALTSLGNAAKQRKAHLIALAEENPQEFLKIVLPKNIRDELPQELKDDIESEINFEGSLEVYHEDDFERQETRFFYYINAKNERFSLHSPKPFPQLLSGKIVKVSGQKITNKIVISSFDEHNFKVIS